MVYTKTANREYRNLLHLRGSKEVPGIYFILEKMNWMYNFRNKSIADITPLIKKGVNIIRQSSEGNFDAKAPACKAIFTESEIKCLDTMSTVKRYVDGTDEKLMDNLPKLIKVKEYIESKELRKICYNLLINIDFISERSNNSNSIEQYSLTEKGIKTLTVLNDNSKIIVGSDRFVRNLLRDIQLNKRIISRHLLDL